MVPFVLLFVIVNVMAQGKIGQCPENATRTFLCFTDKGYTSPLEKPDLHPLEVFTGVDLYDIIDVSEDDHSITVHGEFQIQWNDTGISFARPEKEGMKTQEYYELIDSEIGYAWRPVMTFQNLLIMNKMLWYGSDIYSNLWMKHPHQLTYTERLQITISCDFDFSSFPFDKHECDLLFGDPLFHDAWLYYDTPSIYYKNKSCCWEKDEKHLFIDRPRLPFKCFVEPIKEFSLYKANSGLHYSYSGIRIRLERDSLGKLLAGFFMLTGIFAMLSILSYSISPEAVPGRMGMLVMLYLITANTYASVDGPRDRNFSYIEIWMVGIQMPMLLALFEYGYILYCMKYLRTKGMAVVEDQGKISVPVVFQEKKSLDQNKRYEWFKRMDKACAILSFGYFLVFNIIYWSSVLA